MCAIVVVERHILKRNPLASHLQKRLNSKNNSLSSQKMTNKQMISHRMWLNSFPRVKAWNISQSKYRHGVKFQKNVKRAETISHHMWINSFPRKHRIYLKVNIVVLSHLSSFYWCYNERKQKKIACYYQQVLHMYYIRRVQMKRCQAP